MGLLRLRSIWRDIAILLMISVIAYGMSRLFGLGIGVGFLILGIAIYFVKDYINWWSPQVYQVLILIFILAIGIYIAQMISNSKYWVINILVGGIYLAILFKKPEFILLISATLIPNMFSLIPYEVIQIKGMFKIRDLLLMTILILAVMKVLIQHDNLKSIFGNISAYTILGFCSIILLFVISTCIRHSHPLFLSFRIARDYFYFLFFFATVCCIKNRRQLNFVIKGMVLLSIIFAVMYITQALSGGALHLFPAYEEMKQSIMLGVPLSRSYISCGFTEAICFGLIGLVGIVGNKKLKLIGAIGAVLLLGEIFFTFGRTLWYKTVVIVLLIFLFLPRDKKKIFGLQFILLIFGFIVFMIFIGMLRYGTGQLMLKGLIERAGLGFTDIAQQSGTFGYRLHAFMWYYYTVIQKNIWFGLGFVYPGTEITKTIPYSTVIWADNPLASILNCMGIVGLTFYVLLYVVFVWRGFYILNRLNTPAYRGFVIGFIAWYIGGWMGIFTSGEMIVYDLITIKALCVGLTECMYRIEKGNSDYSNAL
ncbi:MAG: hypothetical protein HY769_04370 [Candidatus Stahlbacteria bacterium]|nr:hypothetical protein [Candidatus Stahlbacteria bacterium]